MPSEIKVVVSRTTRDRLNMLRYAVQRVEEGGMVSTNTLISRMLDLLEEDPGKLVSRDSATG